MKHVFVETNFVVDVLRPFPRLEASQLLRHHDEKTVTLYLPWCSVFEAKRTLERVIREDLGFVDNAGRFLGRVMADELPPAPFHVTVTEFVRRGRQRRMDALYDCAQRVDELAARLTIVPPSPIAIEKTLQLFPMKSLAPFDEMVLGTVVAHAEQLTKGGCAPMFFCSLNTRDFQPTQGNDLAGIYGAVGLEFRGGFDVS